MEIPIFKAGDRRTVNRILARQATLHVQGHQASVEVSPADEDYSAIGGRRAVSLSASSTLAAARRSGDSCGLSLFLVTALCVLGRIAQNADALTAKPVELF